MIDVYFYITLYMIYMNIYQDYKEQMTNISKYSLQKKPKGAVPKTNQPQQTLLGQNTKDIYICT